MQVWWYLFPVPVMAQLRNAPDQMDPELSSLFSKYEFSPKISRSRWEAIGNRLVTHETNGRNPNPDEFVTLRLDIRGMSPKVTKFCKWGLLQAKWDTTFAEWMTDVALELSTEFQALKVFTQSDEITLVLKQARYLDFKGRRSKLESQSAALASSILNRHMLLRWQSLPSTNNNRPKLPPLLCFDCRLGIWPTEEAAFELILWRAYDCSVNGVSTAIHNAVPGAMEKLSTEKKLLALEKLNLLTLSQHQAYGRFFQRQLVIGKSLAAIKPRSKMVPLEGNVLRLAKNNPFVFGAEKSVIVCDVETQRRLRLVKMYVFPTQSNCME
jgi:tRNA(His) 5'-end guanylyltransferase